MTRKGPDEAYRFAKGEVLEHTDGESIQLARPLDFAAVTDHAEFLGEMAIARNSDGNNHSQWADDEEVETLRNTENTVENGRWAIQRFNLRELSEVPPERDGLTNVPADAVLKAAREPWDEIVASANRHNEPGEFTAFIGFEWTHMPNSAMLHRNIIYRGSEAPELPVSRYEKSSPEALWDWLDSERAAGRTAIAIPHNTNWSNGLAFAPPREAGRKWAEQRARLEPQVEIFQNKGASETAPRWATEDEWADFEILFPDAPRTSYVREGLKEGLRLAATLGVNPFAVGIIASTDTHSATPGAVSEEDFRGHNGISDDEPGERLGLKRGMYGNSRSYNPGGLAGVWADQNSRAAIFDALVRKETFGTSGPRIRVRSFVLPEASEDFLDAENAVTTAYATGWPMGATVSAEELGDAPVFLLWATQDPDGAKLQRLQVVKGWYEAPVDASSGGNPGGDSAGDDSAGNGDNGTLREQVIDVKVAEDGAAELKTLWRDPGYNPEQPAFYYVRVLEVPTARWPMHDAAKVGMLDVNLEEGRIQERAWGSPIWVVP